MAVSREAAMPRYVPQDGHEMLFMIFARCAITGKRLLTPLARAVAPRPMAGAMAVAGFIICLYAV